MFVDFAVAEEMMMLRINAESLDVNATVGRYYYYSIVVSTEFVVVGDGTFRHTHQRSYKKNKQTWIIPFVVEM